MSETKESRVKLNMKIKCYHYWVRNDPIPLNPKDAFKPDAGKYPVKYKVRCKYCGKKEIR